MIAFGLRASISATGVRARHDLGVDVRLADAPRDQLRVLRAEVDDEDQIVVVDSIVIGRVTGRAGA